MNFVEKDFPKISEKYHSRKWPNDMTIFKPLILVVKYGMLQKYQELFY